MKKSIVIGLLLLGGVFYVLKSQNINLFGPSQKRIRTTLGHRAIKNLDGRILGIEKVLAKMPKDRQAPLKKKLMSSFQTRMTFLGTFDDLEKAEKLVDTKSFDKDQILTNISFFMTTHQFDKAETEIARLSQKSGTELSAKGHWASVNMARGKNLAQAREDQLRILGVHKSYANYVALAGIEMELGEYKEAEKYFKKSIEVYRGTSPFAPAYTHFQLGVMFGEKIFDLHRAKLHYKEAMAYLPQYVKARVHLSEIYMVEGKTQEALQLLLDVRDVQDPEVKATIAEIYLSMGKNKEAKPYLAQAAEDYEVLLQNYELAFGDHGAEFFMGVGDNPKRALKLALRNLENRKSQGAFELAQEAIQRAQEHQKELNIKM
ncbi:MAG: tetratricopeptide repeat protein [Pseudomonadota bacterium]